MGRWADARRLTVVVAVAVVTGAGATRDPPVPPRGLVAPVERQRRERQRQQRPGGCCWCFACPATVVAPPSLTLVCQCTSPLIGRCITLPPSWRPPTPLPYRPAGTQAFWTYLYHPQTEVVLLAAVVVTMPAAVKRSQTSRSLLCG